MSQVLLSREPGQDVPTELRLGSHALLHAELWLARAAMVLNFVVAAAEP
jgi:hypothetical protein